MLDVHVQVQCATLLLLWKCTRGIRAIAQLRCVELFVLFFESNERIVLPSWVVWDVGVVHFTDVLKILFWNWLK